MKMTRKSALLVASVAMVASSHAAIVSFSGPVTATNTAALDTEWLAGGTLVEAVNVGSGAQSFTTAGGQSISFANWSSLGNVDMPPATAPSSSGLYNGGSQNNASCFPGTTDVAAWTTCLRGNAWHNNASDATRPLTLALTGLTIGQEYSVSLFSADARSSDRSQAYWDSFSGGAFSGGTSGSFSQNPAYKVSGTFVADATTQYVFIQATDAVGNADTTLAAYSLYAIPEPATLGLVGLFGIGTLFVRRRLML